MAKKSYIATGFGAHVRTTDGYVVALPAGGPVPENADPDHVKHLLDHNLVVEGEHEGGAETILAGNLEGEPLSAPGKAASKAHEKVSPTSVGSADDSDSGSSSSSSARKG